MKITGVKAVFYSATGNTEEVVTAIAENCRKTGGIDGNMQFYAAGRQN